MPNNRTVLISLDHLVAEIVAFPFCSFEGMNQGVWALHPNLKNSTAPLWRDAEVYFTSRFPHTSIDELTSLRNRIWFGQDCERTDCSWISLTDFLTGIARSYLEARGSVAVPKLPDALHGRGGIASGEAPDPAARRAWRWLTFALPSDLLLAGLRTDSERPALVSKISPAVEAVLSHGYAETHLHFGIAFDFSAGWAAAVNQIGRGPGRTPGMPWNAFVSPGAAHDEGANLAGWLVRGAIVRYLLAAFLRWGRKPTASNPQGTSLREFLNHRDDLFADNQNRLGLAGQSGYGILDQLLSSHEIAALRVAISDVQSGRFCSRTLSTTDLKSEFLRLQTVYNRLTRVSVRPFPQLLDQVQTLDPLSDFYDVHDHPGPSVQLQFLWDGLDYLRTTPEDTDFARLFWQVERIRCHVYRHCIQRPLTPGLTNFIRFYERKGAIAAPLDDIVLESAGVLGGIGHGLKSLEIRTSPRRNRDSQYSDFDRLRKKLNQLTTVSRVNRNSAWKRTECGLILHFLKFRGGTADKGYPAALDADHFADPANSINMGRYRWQRYFVDRRREARAIVNAVKLDPHLLEFFRGIDVCRDEPGVPTWVIAPLFHEVRRGINKIRSERKEREGKEFPPLRTTAHVGEDFVHLATGVRFMDEAMRFLPLEGGDRVGHGLALGTDAKEWARRSPRLAMPREDRWLDLVWERHWHADPLARFSVARKAFVEDEIIRLARQMFDRPGDSTNWTVQLAIEFVCRLHRFESLRAIGFPESGTVLDDSASEVTRLIHRYLTSSTVYRRCRCVEWVESARDGEAVEELQRLVRRRFADLGITIEVNPISNLLVGDLSDLEGHPLWRLAPGLGHDDGATIRMCIGSDDPFPFATTLPEEYQFLFDSLVLAGKSQAEAREWIDRVRKMGYESRFTRPVLTD